MHSLVSALIPDWISGFPNAGHDEYFRASRQTEGTLQSIGDETFHKNQHQNMPAASVTYTLKCQIV